MLKWLLTTIVALTAKVTFDKLQGIYNLKNVNPRVKEFVPLIKKYSKLNGVPFGYALALVETESEFLPEAIRTEPAYYERYVLNNPRLVDNPFYGDPDTIAASYGLTQIMYPTALGEGFPSGAHPSGLFDPGLNLKLGLSYFKKSLELAKREEGNDNPALAYLKYNAGPGTNFSNASEQALANTQRFSRILKKVYETFAL